MYWYCYFCLVHFRYDISGKSGERDQFKQQVRSCVMEWRDRTFSSPSIDDPHYLTFSPYEPKVHEPVRQAMMTDARKLEQEEEEVNDRLHKLPVFKLFGLKLYITRF